MAFYFHVIFLCVHYSTISIIYILNEFESFFTQNCNHLLMNMINAQQTVTRLSLLSLERIQTNYFFKIFLEETGLKQPNPDLGLRFNLVYSDQVIIPIYPILRNCLVFNNSKISVTCISLCKLSDI